MNKIIGIDLGTQMGFTLDGKIGQTVKFSQTDSKFYSFYKHLESFILLHDIKVIAYEGAAFQQGNAIAIWHGLVGVLKTLATKYSIKTIAIPVGTVKKCFTGKGRHTKEEQEKSAKKLGLKKANSKSPILDRCYELGLVYDSEDAADSLAVYFTYKQMYEGKE